MEKPPGLVEEKISEKALPPGGSNIYSALISCRFCSVSNQQVSPTSGDMLILMPGPMQSVAVPNH